MKLFENANTWTKQGDIGEARAIYEYTKLGYGVLKPLNDSMKYDLVIDRDGLLQKVQVKTTMAISPEGNYVANLKTSGGNRSTQIIKNRQDEDYNILFVLTDNNECYSIPTTNIKARANLTLSNSMKQFLL